MTRSLALLLPVLLGLAAPAAPFRLEELLPEGTLVFAEIPSAGEFQAAFKKTRLHAFFQDEEVRTFAGSAFDAALKNFEGFSKEFEQALGLPWDRAWELPTGQVAFAIPAVARDNDRQPDALFTLEAPGKRETLKKLVGFARKHYEANSGKKAEAWKAGDEEGISGDLVAPVRWHLAVLGDVLVAGTWRPTIEELASSIAKGRPAPLSKSALFVEAKAKAATKELFLFADLASLVKEAKERLGEDEQKALKSLGLDSFRWAAGGLSFGAASVTERFFLATGPERKGLAKFASLKGAAPGFENAPADALYYFSFSIDAAELYDTVLEVLKGVDEVEAQRVLDSIAEFEKEAGVSLKNDLFAAFGPRVFAYSAFPAPGLVPDAVTSFEIKDAAKFEKCLKAACAAVPAEVVSLDFEGRKIQYFRFQEPGDFGDPLRFILPSLYWMRDGDRLHFSGPVSLAPGYGAAAALKRHVMREKQAKLSAAPAVRDWAGGGTDGASMVLYVDLERGFTALYNTLAPLALLFKDMLGAGGAGVDLAKMPLGETIGRHLAQTIHRVNVEPGGLRVEAVSASGTTLTAAGFVAAAGVVLYPALSQITREQRTSACRSQLSAVYFAAVQHHADKQKYPDKTGEDFLKQLRGLGYLDGDLDCPHAGAPAWRGPAKDMNQMADADVVFCDEPGNHPDGSINVLRKNGETESLKPGDPGYARALETTKGR
jgi:hypothetical protein